jgi:hypothetical protein
MALADDLSKFARIANGTFNSVTANSTAITALNVGGASINSTAFPGTANNASNLGGVAAASYQLNSTLAANVATMAANSATFANSSSTNTFTVGTAAYFVANGNLGIGTLSPGVRLDVAGSVRSNQSVTIGNTGGTYTAGSIYSDVNWGMIFRAAQASPTNANFRWANAGDTELMRIDSSGNVGIGTASPNATLAITGTANVSGNVVVGGTLTTGSTLTVPYLAVTAQGGIEGGEMQLARPTSNTTLAGAVTFDIFANTLRVYEAGGSFRGVSVDFTGCGSQSALLHSSNFNSYAPTLTGTGASGTWGISITGNAATVTNGVYTTGSQSIGGFKTFTSDFAIYTGTVGTQIILQNWGWSNGIARWKPVLESDASFSLFNYDTAGGTPVRSFFSTNGTGSYSQFSNSIRAPIFFDSDDTTYYVNPNGGSQLQGHTRFGPYAGSVSSGNQTGVEIMNAGGTGDGNVAAISYHCQGAYGMHQHLRADGYFGIGGWSASAWRWYVFMGNGDMTASGNVVAYSDPRLKENITKIESPVEKLKKLNGMRFRWKQNSILGHPGEYDYGVLANEVQEVFPEIVTDSMHDSPDGDRYKAVAYDKLVPVLIEAVKAQQNEIEELKTLVKSLVEKR